MKALDIKLFRDVRRMWAQVLAIALVVGGGVATLVLAVGSHRSLEETRIAYYERYGFGDVFAQAKRAPRALADTIADIPGVAAVDTRIPKLALLDIPGFSEPASGQFVSLLTTPSRTSIGCTSVLDGFRSRGGQRRSSSTSRSRGRMGSPKGRGSRPF